MIEESQLTSESRKMRGKPNAKPSISSAFKTPVTKVLSQHPRMGANIHIQTPLALTVGLSYWPSAEGEALYWHIF